MVSNTNFTNISRFLMKEEDPSIEAKRMFQSRGMISLAKGRIRVIGLAMGVAFLFILTMVESILMHEVFLCLILGTTGFLVEFLIFKLITNSKRVYIHAESSNLIVSRYANAWTIQCGFRAVCKGKNIRGKHKSLLRVMDCYKGITLKFIVSRHVFPRMIKREDATWFDSETEETFQLPGNRGGYAWIILIQKDLSIIKNRQKQLQEFMEARHVLSRCIRNSFPHHKFNPLQEDELMIALGLP